MVVVDILHNNLEDYMDNLGMKLVHSLFYFELFFFDLYLYLFDYLIYFDLVNYYMKYFEIDLMIDFVNFDLRYYVIEYLYYYLKY